MAQLQLLLLAYNLVHWFKQRCLPEVQLRTTVETLSANLINRSGKMSWCCPDTIITRRNFSRRQPAWPTSNR